ncbi:hypothetical protein M501DRAFT_1058497 [Patellaria atrata CBS 101060]|uniref:Wax synthase domain-containing protein n=1 Tax=Patellaria atrata CBS 101060 TaxID=1346257 RepID=A0A9P4VM88_9PEZI|nr:hypothetical protein M501DRAFT_1058497 [Patellaria atrata CBS 101060]
MSYVTAEQRVQNDYLSALQAGNFTPPSFPLSSLNIILLIGWLMVCQSVSESSFQRGRWIVFIAIAFSSIWNLLFVRAPGVTGSIGTGLNSVLCTVMAVNFLLLHDPRSFKRLILRPQQRMNSTNGQINQKQLADGNEAKEHIRSKQAGKRYHNMQNRPGLEWEPMPRETLRRLAWVFDLITCFRGVHWSWKSPPPSSHPLLLSNVSLGQTTTLFRNLSRFLIGYIVLDAVKSLMIADLYFTHYPIRTPPPHIARYIASPLGLYTYRMLLATLGGYSAIDLEYSTTVLLQVNILGPNILGLNASPATFPPIWGSPHAILRKGLRGFWGDTWHQMLRMHFVSIGDAIAQGLLRNVHVNSNSRQDKVKETDRHNQSSAEAAIRVVVVFLLSGVLHACGSYTLLGSSRPSVSFLFFALQPFGMAIQSTCSYLFCSSQLFFSLGRYQLHVRQISNFFFTILWLWAFAGLFADDLTSGGMWMFEPVPVSFFRGLGFSEDRRFWCW